MNNQKREKRFYNRVETIDWANDGGRSSIVQPYEDVIVEEYNQDGGNTKKLFIIKAAYMMVTLINDKCYVGSRKIKHPVYKVPKSLTRMNDGREDKLYDITFFVPIGNSLFCEAKFYEWVDEKDLEINKENIRVISDYEHRE